MSDFNVGFVIFPGITQLDFTGPYEVLSRLGTPASISVQSKFASSKVHVVAKSLSPVMSDRGLVVAPTCTFVDCTPLDLICVLGEQGSWMHWATPTRSNSFAAKGGARNMCPRSAPALFL